MQRGKYREEEILFLKNNAEKYGINYCAQELKRSVKGIKAKCIRLGIKIKDVNFDIKDAPKFNTEFKELELDFTKVEFPRELAYFLGYFWADGYISKSGLIAIEILTQDANNVEGLFKKVASFHRKDRIRKNRKPVTTFYISSQEKANTLKALGKYPKSKEGFDKIIKYIPKDYHKYFIRGVFDGDGNLYLSTKSKGAWFSISGRIEQEWTALVDLLKSFGLKCRIEKRNHSTSNSYSSLIKNTNGNELNNFFKIIYSPNDSIYLDRKYKIIQLFWSKVKIYEGFDE